MLLLSAVEVGGSYLADVLPGMTVAGLGLGLILVCVSVSVMTAAPEQQSGMLSGLNTTGHEIGGTIGIAILVTVAMGVGGGPASSATRLASGISDAFLAAGAPVLTATPTNGDNAVLGSISCSAASVCAAVGAYISHSAVEVTLAESYTAPTVTSVSPDAGPVAGGNTVTITGTGSAAGATVNFGSTPASSVLVRSANQITATAPASSPGTGDVTVTEDGVTSATSAVDRYTYQTASTSTQISCDPASLTVGSGSTCTVTVTDASSAPTPPTGAVTLTASGPGLFSGGCSLAAADQSAAACTANFVPSAAGSDTIAAASPGDVAHAPSSATFTQTVTPAASPGGSTGGAGGSGAGLRARRPISAWAHGCRSSDRERCALRPRRA